MFKTNILQYCEIKNNDEHMEFIINRKPFLLDSSICILELGHSKPHKGKRADAVTSCFQFHYVTSGEGLFRGERIIPGCGFLVFPGEKQGMSVESDDFEQFWINFNGNDVSTLLSLCKIKNHSSVYKLYDTQQKAKILTDLFLSVFYQNDLSDDVNPVHNHNYLIGLLYQILSLIDNRETDENIKYQENYADAVCSYIMSHYSENLTVDWLAATVGLSPKYLSRVFAKARGVSMIEYLTDVRINNACGLLLGTNNLISDIAERVGYKDALYFTKVFKKYMGVSPTMYRATQKQ